MNSLCEVFLWSDVIYRVHGTFSHLRCEAVVFWLTFYELRSNVAADT